MLSVLQKEKITNFTTIFDLCCRLLLYTCRLSIISYRKVYGVTIFTSSKLITQNIQTTSTDVHSFIKSKMPKRHYLLKIITISLTTGFDHATSNLYNTFTKEHFSNARKLALPLSATKQSAQSSTNKSSTFDPSKPTPLKNRPTKNRLYFTKQCVQELKSNNIRAVICIIQYNTTVFDCIVNCIVFAIRKIEL